MILYKQTVLTFGKHKGKTIADVIACDPSYVVWLHDVCANVTVSSEAIDEARATFDKKVSEYFDKKDFTGRTIRNQNIKTNYEKDDN